MKTFLFEIKEEIGIVRTLLISTVVAVLSFCSISGFALAFYYSANYFTG